MEQQMSKQFGPCVWSCLPKGGGLLLFSSSKGQDLVLKKKMTMGSRF
jgi:hypothetical protein